MSFFYRPSLQHAQIAEGAGRTRAVALEDKVRTLSDRCAILNGEVEALRLARDVRATDWLKLTALNALLRGKVS